MFKVGLACVCVAMLCDFERTEGTSYDFEQVSGILDKLLLCLETKYPVLNSNGTFGVAYGLAQIPYTFYTVPNLNPCNKKTLEKFGSRMDEFLERSLENLPQVLDSFFWHPRYWMFSGGVDYRFKRGRIPEQPPLNQSMAQLFEGSNFTTENFVCYQDLLFSNLKSARPRECTVPCQQQTYDQNFEVGLVPDQRWMMIAAEVFLNCTNNSPQVVMDAWTVICRYEKRQVDALFLKRDELKNYGLRWNFLFKILHCALSGFPEFLSEDLMTYLIGTIGCDGCVGESSDNEEDIFTMTAYTAGILGESLRLIQEETNGLPFVK